MFSSGRSYPVVCLVRKTFTRALLDNLLINFPVLLFCYENFKAILNYLLTFHQIPWFLLRLIQFFQNILFYYCQVKLFSISNIL